jgi:hypothetical protein
VEGSIIIRGLVTEGRLFSGAVAEGAWQRASVWRGLTRGGQDTSSQCYDGGGGSSEGAWGGGRTLAALGLQCAEQGDER